MADLSKEDLSAVFEKFFGTKLGTKIDPKDFQAMIDGVKKTSKELKDSLPVSKQFNSLLHGTIQQYQDIALELDNLEKSIVEARVAGDELAESELIQAKNQIKQTAALNNTKIALTNFSIGVAGVLGTLADGALDYAKNLQGGASGVQSATAAAVATAKAAGETANITGTLISGAGSALQLFGGEFRAAGLGLELFGTAVGVIGKKAADLSAKALEYLGKELDRTQKAYKEVTDTGAVLAGGMTELRNRAADAGLDVEQFANAIKNSREELSMMGMGLGEGAKRMGAVNKELRNSQFGTQLQKLGYSMEEQAQLTAQVMANNNAAGEKRRLSDTEVARQTAEYGKSLKILSDITGEDAKKAMEKARMQAMEADLMAQAMAEGGSEAVLKLQAQLATMPEALKKGYMEFVSTGGSAVADAATNVAITQNPKIMEQYRQQYNDLSNGAVDQKRALENTGRYTEQTGKYALENMENTKQVGLAARMTGDALTGGATNIANGLIVAGTKLKEGATDAASKATEGAAINTAPLDQAVADLEADAQRTKAALTKELTPAITQTAETYMSTAKSIKQTMDELGLREKSTGEKVGNVAGGITGSVGGGALGASLGAGLGGTLGTFLLPGIGTIGGAELGGLAGGALGTWLGGLGGEAAGGWLGSKFAVGGVVNKPTKALIGEAGMPEAVIPMPDGRSIPIAMPAAANTSDDTVTASMDELIDLTREMIGHLRDHKDLTQKILNVSM
jgi:hypothetical protein